LTDQYRPHARPLAGGARPPARRRGTLGYLAVILFVFLAGLGLIASISVVVAFTTLANDPDLPNVKTLTTYELPEETVIYDRTGTVELARFGEFRREVVTFAEIPPILLDATTAIEDKTFWENAGFDPVGIISAGLDSLRGDGRGASTITQQLVRARLLDEALVQDPKRTVERKLKEIIQSIRLTQAFPGEEGKREIITAYLNQNYYGNQTYGVAAAARAYFGKALADLTPAEAAIIAALPQSPSNYDLVRNAVERCDVVVADGEDCPPAERTLVVPDDTKIVTRRNAVLQLLAEGGRTPISGDRYSAADFEVAKSEPVILASQATPRWKAPHFVWAVRDELTAKICGPDADTCPRLERGGFRVTTTLDLDLQKVAEKWVKLAARVPHRKDPAAAAKALGFAELPSWVRNLVGKNVRNGALVALDYQTGELVAYVGSADYYSTAGRPEFQPQYDVVGQGFRQPGSAFKPFNYAIGIDDHTFTAGTMFMDSATDFGGGYTPTNADNLERGPVRVRKALQFSLNIPSVKAMVLNDPGHAFAKAKEFGLTFQSDTTDAGAALALGVAETRPVDLVTGYGTLANEGRYIGHTTILTVTDRAGKDVVDPYVPPPGEPVVSPQSAFIVTDILRENTVRAVNPYWGRFQIRDEDGTYRPATLKTGTNNDAKDLNAYGYIAPPTQDGRGKGAYALAVGVWNGNSDNTPVSTPARPVFSIDIATYVWQGFLKEVSATWPITRFARPDSGLDHVAIDPFTGLLPGSGVSAVDEWFLTGTAPTQRLASGQCGIDVVRAVGVETRYESWMAGTRDWLRRAAKGPGTVGGPDRTRTSYFYNGSFNPYGRTWGPLVDGEGCGAPSPSPSCFLVPTPDPSTGIVPSFVVPSPSGAEPVPLPCPTPTPSLGPSPSVDASPSVSPLPTPTATPPPTASPTPEPTAEPTAAPTATPQSTPSPTPGQTVEPTPNPVRSGAPPDHA